MPLQVHARYQREEILSALGHATLQRLPSYFREGVMRSDELGLDAFFVTLRKTETDYSPTTMYQDYAISPTLFHWESQSTTSAASKTGQRYLDHRAAGSEILIFSRAAKLDALGTMAYTFLGTADYVSHTGDRPIGITWQAESPDARRSLHASQGGGLIDPFSNASETRDSTGKCRGSSRPRGVRGERRR